MASQDRDTNNTSPDPHDAANLAKAFQELAKGEQTAAALEKQLTAMEAKIEMLLAQTEEQQRLTQHGGATASAHNGSTTGQDQEKPDKT
ncbi:uncharacterized protein RCC_03822 [Ramularia collo-cygni]|uniref:Uncharacterized protein n=1 Tax=Ramularia collo-cygni TaxID=112498 RepID=A0A2D3VBW8_9PEZI|nr:uncharacterized protein RCC_03822 [Ramularia collo-cygni]CZT17983.1 uncharacterized protein RCC_03822 [Ramularia collo-cygni]